MTPGSDKDITNPFPGLRPFREEEEHLFFGRERQVDAMVDKLAQRRFLAVVGTSGSGKSSLVNCGLRPALHQGRMSSAGTAWRMAQFRPGNHPLAAMAQALAKDGVLFRNFQERGLPLVEIIDTTLRMSKRGLIDIFEQAALPKGVNLLVVVDQFEELFRYRQLVDGPQADGHGFSEKATAFVKLLLELQEQKDCPIFVVLTMRSDFLGDCTQLAGLAEAINAGLYLVPRLTSEERREAIMNPIRVRGAEITPVLVTRLVNDVGDNPDQLSILQHALNRTWARWQAEGGTGPIDLPHYEAIGTMERALDAHAEQAYAELASPGQESSQRQWICETLFKALTDKASDGRGIRRPTTLVTLCALADEPAAEMSAVIDVFRHPSRSFLMPPASEGLEAETVLDISHESLMRVWERLKRWVEEEAQSAQIYRRLAERAALHGKGEAATLRDPELSIYRKWRQQHQPNAVWGERYAPDFGGAMAYLERSAAERDAELAAQERRRQEEAQRELNEANRARRSAEDRQRLLRRGLIAMGTLAVLAIASTAYAVQQLQVARNAQGQAFAATSQALLSAEPTDPFGAVVHGLAAMGPLADDPQESIPLTSTLSKAVTRNRLIGAIETNQGRVNGLIEQKNGELISGGGDGTLRRWRDGKPVGDGKPIATGQGRVWSLIRLKNGELISGGLDGTLRRWRDGKPVGDGKPIATGQKGVRSLIELRNGEVISGGVDGTMRRWKGGKAVGDGKPFATGQGQVWSLIELMNGELISGGSDGTLRRWKEGKAVGDGKPIVTGQEGVRSLIELKNGEVISGGLDGTLRRWKDGKAVGDGKPIATGQKAVLSLIERRNGEVISGSEDGTLRRWKDGKAVGDGKPIATGQKVVLSLVALNNRELISGGGDGTMRRWRDGKPVGDGKPIATGQKEVLRLIELRNGELISGGIDGTLRRWKEGKAVGDGKPITTGQKQLWSLIELNNGEVISGGGDGTLRRWKEGKAVGDGKPIATGQGEVFSLIELKNGEMISGGFDGSLRRWRDGKPVGDGKPIATGQGAVISLIELKNGELISGGFDGTLRRWKDGKAVGDGKPIDTGQGQVWNLIELKNGEMISGSEDGTLRRWRWVPPKAILRAACVQLREHPALLTPQTSVEKEARRTCRSVAS